MDRRSEPNIYQLQVLRTAIMLSEWYYKDKGDNVCCDAYIVPFILFGVLGLAIFLNSILVQADAYDSPSPPDSNRFNTYLSWNPPNQWSLRWRQRPDPPTYYTLPSISQPTSETAGAAGFHCSLVEFGFFLGLLPFHHVAPAYGSLT